MFYNINYLDNKSEYSNLDILFNKKLNSMEKSLLTYLFRKYKSEKEEFIKIEKKELTKLLKTDVQEEIIRIFSKLFSKNIIYSLLYKNEIKLEGFFGILNSFTVENNCFIITFSKEIILSFEKNNFFSSINLSVILLFRNSYSLKIYLEIINSREFTENGEINFSLDELKKFFEIEEIYTRFYDLERKVLKPIVDDINNLSEYKISITKEKNGEAKSSRIANIKIKFTNLYLTEIKNQTNYLINLVKHNINDFNFIYKFLLENLKEHGYDYVYEKIKLILSEADSNNFEHQLKIAFNVDILSDDSLNEHIIVEEIFINSWKTLYEELITLLKKMNLEDVVKSQYFNNLFYKIFYILKDKKTYFLNYQHYNTTVDIKFTYFSKKKSSISIRSKQNKM